MKGTEIKIIYRDPNELIPYEKNAKKHDQTQINNVAESIDRYGFIQPVVIDSENVIVIGHCRTLAALQLGLEKVPCVCVDDLTPEQVKALRIIDNKTNESEWDVDLLQAELLELDLSGFDFDFDFSLELDLSDAIEAEEDEPPEVDEENEPITKQGDIWQLGRHRLLCGDSTKKEDVEKLMDGNMADLLLTDPPYNVALGMGGSVDEARKRHRRTDGLVIMNDKMEDSEFRAFLTTVFENAKDVMAEGASYYIWHADNEGYNFRGALIDAGFQLRQTIIWAKNSITLGRQDYQWKHEPCLYGWKEGAAHNWYSDRKQSTLLEFNRPSRSEEHPTMKPVKLFDYQIKNSSRPGNVVLDLFGGSGTTIIACEQNGRTGYLMELDPKYCDVIVKRWENLTGEKAVLVNGR